MFGKVLSSCIVGIEGKEVIVEADYGDGLPAFEMVGFLGSEVKEARERVKAALKNSAVFVPPGRLTVNLSPADLRKQGNSFDLPIAIAILTAIGIIPQDFTEDYLFTGELALDGSLRAVNGTLSHVLLARELKKKGCVLPSENAREGTLVPGMEIYGFSSLSEVLDFLLKKTTKEPEVSRVEEADVLRSNPLDFSEIMGQESVKRAAEVASSGMHGLLLIGPPGTGKTLTAKRIPTILPPLTESERLESSRIYSVAGMLDREKGLIKDRPFRSPHHTISANALVGGGAYPHPGEMSLAHNGVLFLDELPEFSRAALEALRQPLEDGCVTVSRVHSKAQYQSSFMMIASMNPCPCGYYGSTQRECRCSPQEIRRYLDQISGPLLDRIDIQIEVDSVPVHDIRSAAGAESSATVAARVLRARRTQQDRYRDSGIHCNAQLNNLGIRKYCPLTAEAENLLHLAVDRMNLSMRAYHRVIKVARTIADLQGTEAIGTAEIAEAVQYRELDHKYW